MGLRNRIAGKRLAPLLVVALCAGQVELPLALEKCLAPRLQVLADRLAPGLLDRQAARLPADIGRQREQLAALELQRGRLLLLHAADVYALIDVYYFSC